MFLSHLSKKSTVMMFMIVISAATWRDAAFADTAAGRLDFYIEPECSFAEKVAEGNATMEEFEAYRDCHFVVNKLSKVCAAVLDVHALWLVEKKDVGQSEYFYYGPKEGSMMGGGHLLVDQYMLHWYQAMCTK